MSAETPPIPPSPEVLLFREFTRLLETNPNLKFTVFGIGDITGKLGDTAGRRLFQYDNTKKQLIDNSDISGNFDSSVINDKKEQLPLFQKVVVHLTFKGKMYLGFKENVRGQKNSKFFHDERAGNRFFAGFQANTGEGLYSDQELDILGKILDTLKEKPEIFIHMMEGLCHHYIGAYYKEMERIEETWNARVR